MRRLLRPQWLALLCCLLVLLFLAGAGQHNRLFERGWFNLNQWWSGVSEQAIDLGSYRARVQARPIDGVENVSALTYDPTRKTLFTVTNKQSEVLELSLGGRILRRIPMTGFGDPEAIEYISPGIYVITDENLQRLIKVRIADDTTFLDAHDAEQMSLGIGIGSSRNLGFEGLAYDSVQRRLFVAKERDPMLIYEVQGFPYEQDSSPEVHVVQNVKRDNGLFVRDLSSLQYDERSGHLMALSDESRLVLELDVEGRPLSSLSLRKGSAGLVKTVPQPEGIAMDDDGVLYLVSEPNLFYVFGKDR
jgi:uncharacterized protein YjiK